MRAAPFRGDPRLAVCAVSSWDVAYPNAHQQGTIMTIKAGDKIPSVTLKWLSSNGLQDLTTDSVFGGKKVVMFAVPGALTPTCSARHLPGFVQNLDKFKEQGIEVACVAVNDPFVMKAWSEAGNAEGITMLADGNGTFIKALGLELDEPVTVSVPAHSALRFTPKIA